MIGAKGRLGFFDRIILFINYCFAFALLVSYLAPFTDPKSFWLIAFFGLAYPPLLLVNGLLALYWLFRFKIQILISVLSVAVGWGVLQKNIGFHNKTDTDRAKADGSQIRMMAYNVHSFNSPMDYNIPTRREILQIIKDQQPDIINMEEFYSTSKGRTAMCDSIKKILQTSNYYFKPFGSQPDNGSGLAIVSKYPIVNHGVIMLASDNSDTKAIFVDVTINGKTIRVYCVHLQSFLFSAQDHIYMDSVTQQRRTSITGSRRIGSKLKLGFIRRSDQVKVMKAEMAKCPFPYIIAGDFNDTPSSWAVNQMADGIKNAFREQGRGLGRTYNGDIPNYQIDYIMVSPQFKVMNYTVIEKKASDHYAVRSDLSLP
ncbi:endonuclease/exonuclease/phosphatase family metal-dependent hydrolase [Mucilaginibacter gracilis]|uniref:Endonuclease/exonuclease/phosphatase family metal-dependent hydrolase n=1 Tax=Mucilaginibacter gracilis TaxID=423350 RepID=A0A495J9X9_9SPHI|nr:endonuclease/exonuclease/phosphatase family protein [Mucilaginibacter gracilis]RKR85288.1 endonuclease/exonuclease/phosphatase family metal-dependent hydrolase [Mucilaginibacter gracilis]